MESALFGCILRMDALGFLGTLLKVPRSSGKGGLARAPADASLRLAWLKRGPLVRQANLVLLMGCKSPSGKG